MRFLGCEKSKKISHISQIELFMEIDEGHGRIFWGFTQQCEGNVKRGGQEKGAGQLPGALGEGAALGFWKGASPLCPGGVGWQKARERGGAPARGTGYLQHTHAECAPRRELPGAQPPRIGRGAAPKTGSRRRPGGRSPRRRSRRAGWPLPAGNSPRSGGPRCGPAAGRGACCG